MILSVKKNLKKKFKLDFCEVKCHNIQLMKSDLLRFRPQQKYCFFDYETCNLNLGSERNKPWQLGLIITEGKRITAKHKYHIKWKDLHVFSRGGKNYWIQQG